MMWDRKELKERGKYAMASNRGACILVALIMGVVSLVFNNSSSGTAGSGTTEAMNGVNGITNMDTEMALLFGAITTVALIISLIGLLLKIFIENTLKVGGYSFFIKNQSGMHPAFDCVLDGFRSGCYGNITLTMFLRDLYVSLWSLLFVIPGIIKNYEYMMVPYILAENPGMDHKTAFKISKRMMDGQKMDAFILDMSFLGWEILSACTFGILGVLYVNPYEEATKAELYAFNKMKGFQEGYLR